MVPARAFAASAGDTAGPRGSITTVPVVARSHAGWLTVGRGVDFTESVKLIAHHVQQQCITGLDLLDEVDGVHASSELEHGDVRVNFAAERDFGKQCGDHAAHEVRAGRIG